MISPSLIGALTLLAAMSAPSNSFAPDGLRLQVIWMNRSDREDILPLTVHGGTMMVAATDLAETLHLAHRTDSSGVRLRIDLPGEWLILTAGTPFILMDGRLGHLPLPVGVDGRFTAPFEPLLSLLAEHYPGELIFDPKRLRLLVTPPQYDILGVHARESPGRIRLIFPAGRVMECQVRQHQSGAELFFPGGTADTNRLNAADGRWVSIRAAMGDDGLHIILVPDSGVAFLGLSRETDPPLFTAEFGIAAAFGDGGAESHPPPESLKSERARWALDVVVIDPGHGGRDPGAVGKSGTYEKNITLDVALRLRKALAAQGIKTEMTRTRDEFIPLDERGKIANRAGGKLFVSLHCNSVSDPMAQGLETYFLAPTKTERAMQVALRENSVIKYEESRDQYRDLTEENLMLLTMAQANFMRESQELADLMQVQVSRSVKMKNRGVDQAGFYVLIGASMPAVLFEMGFLSNKEEERRLNDKHFRQKLAEAIAAAVVRFMQANLD